MSRQRNWVARIWSNFGDPYFNDHLTTKNKKIGKKKWDKTAAQNFKLIQDGDVELN